MEYRIAPAVSGKSDVGLARPARLIWRRPGRMTVRRRHSRMRLTSRSQPRDQPPHPDPPTAESLGFQSIPPGNRLQFDADRIATGTRVEPQSKAGKVEQTLELSTIVAVLSMYPPQSPTRTTNISILKSSGAVHW